MKLMFIEVKGDHASWIFQFYGDPKNIPVWKADGIDVFEVRGSIPAWAVDMGLTRIWFFVQRIWNLRWPFVK